MKNLKNIQLTVTYTVSLGNVKVSKEVFNQLNSAFELGDEIDVNNPAYLKAADWINSNVKESDCMDWRVEIDDLN